MNRCCLCGRKFIGYGNNAQPVMAGRCCDKCNEDVVLPKRLKVLEEQNRVNVERIYR